MEALVEWQYVGHYHARPRSPSHDQIAQMSVIFFYVALAGSNGQALLKDFPEGYEQTPFGGMGIHASGVGGHVQPGNSQDPARVDDLSCLRGTLHSIHDTAHRPGTTRPK